MKKKVLVEQTFGEDPLFAIAFHPSEKHFVTGTSSGQLTANTYTEGDSASANQAWTTKRHKSSCRAIVYDQSGDYVFSAGADRVVKKALSETGKVVGKDKDSMAAGATCMVVNESLLAIGDEDANLCVFDIRTMKKTHSYSGLHDDCVNSISDMPFKNKYHFVTAGSTTVTHIDLRKGIVSQSEDQEDEILSGCIASEKYSAFGMSEGVVTVWNNNHLEDQQNRMRLSDGSIDCLIAGEEDNEVFAGGADGIVRKLDIKGSRVDKQNVWTHGEEEEVSMLELDYDYRLVTGGLESLKIWCKDDEVDQEEDEEDEDEDEKAKKKRKRSKKTKSNIINMKKQTHVHGISKFDNL